MWYEKFGIFRCYKIIIIILLQAIITLLNILLFSLIYLQCLSMLLYNSRKRWPGGLMLVFLNFGGKKNCNRLENELNWRALQSMLETDLQLPFDHIYNILWLLDRNHLSTLPEYKKLRTGFRSDNKPVIFPAQPQCFLFCALSGTMNEFI